MNEIKNPRFIRHPEKDDTEHAILFRHAFTVPQPVKSARLLVCGLGYHQPYLDGVSISEERLTPPPTNFLVRSYYSSVNLQKKLAPGKHTLSVLVGRGFFAMQTKSVWNYQVSPWHGAPMLFARLEIRYQNGECQRIDADESWETCRSPIVRSSLYTGEGYDPEGQTEWVSAAPVTDLRYDAITLYPRLSEPITVLAEYKPSEIFRNAAGNQIVKFPVVLSGTARIRARGKPGSLLKVRYCETLRPDGAPELWQEHVEGELQTDTCRIGSSGIIDWEPVFDYKGFQYMELEGEIDPVSREDVTARQLGSRLRKTGSFTCSNALFNRIYENSLRTLRNNLCGIPTDTPMYEKNGWLGDSGLISESACATYRMESFFKKWLLDIQDCVLEDGLIRAIAPSLSWGDFHAPEWIDTYFEVVWQLYWQYGSTEPIRRHYATMRRYLEYAAAHLDGDGLPDSTLGDWVPPCSGSRGGCAPEGPKISAACYLYKMYTRLSAFAKVLGRNEDLPFCGEARERLKSALNAKYLNRETGVYSTGVTDRFVQSDQILPLAFGLAPEELRARIAANLAADVRERFCHLDTGILGTKYILPVLTEAGEGELAYQVANSRTFPSWGYWIANGATTNFETWGMDARSRDHYMFGTVIDWFYQYLAGIQITGAGYSSVQIRPGLCGPLRSCAASVETPQGLLSVSWEVKNASLFTLKVTLPEGIRGEAFLPDGGAPAALHPGHQVLECGSSKITPYCRMHV